MSASLKLTLGIVVELKPTQLTKICKILKHGLKKIKGRSFICNVDYDKREMLQFTVLWGTQYASWSCVKIVTQDSENIVSDVGVYASNRLPLSIISVEIYQYKGRLLFLRCCRTSICDTE